MSDDADRRTPANEPAGAKVDARLLEILVCPVTRAELTYDPVRQELDFARRAARLSDSGRRPDHAAGRGA